MIYDREIYDCLLKIWNLKYSNQKRKNKTSNRLFRSIEVAYHALSMPKKNQTSINDIGIQIALWVSAFEILAPSKTNAIEKVFELLNDYPNYSIEFKSKKYIRRNKKKQKLSLIEKLYRKLYDSRNTFLHGNNIQKGILRTFKYKESQHNYINKFAPIVYRFALYSFLVKHKFFKYKKSEQNDCYSHAVIDNHNYDKFLKNIIKPKIDLNES